MGINLELPKLTELKPRIVVIGVGGAGGNAINNMIASGLDGVEYIAANTDAQALLQSSAERRIQLGVNLTEGLGAGSKPEIGEAAAEEAIDDIRGQIAGAHMVFIAAGMGGGTGTGAAAVIARISRELDILTVGIVTKPFQFEGTRRMRTAEAGIAELRKYVDTLIVIPNQNLFRIATDKTTFAEAFVLADQVLYSGVACIVDLIVKDGLINLDFADVRTVMGGMGSAMMGTGEAVGERRALRAAEDAISNPLLDEVSLKGAKGVLLSIIGGRDMTLYEVDEAASRVRQEVDPEANIIVGATFDEALTDQIRVAIVASGMTGSLHAQAARAEQAARSGLSSAPISPAMSPRETPAPFGPAQAANSMPAGAPPLPPAGTLPPAIPRDKAPHPRQAPAESDPARTPPSPRSALGLGIPPSPSPIEHSGFAGDEPRELWRAPGNIVIEESRGVRMQPLRQGAPAAPQQTMAAPFTPSAPEAVRRNAARRLPEIDEFPPVGQREYHAKSSNYETAPAPVESSSRPAKAAHEPPARGGLLQRMMGGGKKR
ncbi:MAG: cell division protein FtsZ [Proteobacteria bacterium]|nr:cell division protein FtsZ [Pseudomonadota bacterium]